jgi:hypothetical protein
MPHASLCSCVPVGSGADVQPARHPQHVYQTSPRICRATTHDLSFSLKRPARTFRPMCVRELPPDQTGRLAA